MYRVGEVVSIKGKMAQVKLMRHSACGNCKACKIGDDDGSVYSDVYNELNAKEGDHVEISMEEGNLLGAAAILYGFPLVTMLLSVFIVNFILERISIGNHELILGAVVLLSLTATFAIIRTKNGKFIKSKKYLPVVTKIIEKG